MWLCVCVCVCVHRLMGCVSVSFCLQFQLEIILFRSDFSFLWSEKTWFWTWIHWIKCIFVVKWGFFLWFDLAVVSLFVRWFLNSFSRTKSHVGLMCGDEWFLCTCIAHTAQGTLSTHHQMQDCAYLTSCIGQWQWTALIPLDEWRPCSSQVARAELPFGPKMPMTVRVQYAVDRKRSIKSDVPSSAQNTRNISLYFFTTLSWVKSTGKRHAFSWRKLTKATEPSTIWSQSY